MRTPSPIWMPGPPSPTDDRPRVFIICSVGLLKEVGTDRHGNPIKRRQTCTWGWVPTFDEACDLVSRNVTDLHETVYEYLLVEGVPRGIVNTPRCEWWWRWDRNGEQWVPSDRPADYAGFCAISLG